MALKIYNTFSKTKEDFIPLNPPYVGMYVCGPTVYGHSHLGHGRSYVIFDVMYRYLEYKGYKTRYVQNITDVGHLVGDRDAGEDKIQKQAKLEKLEPVEIAYKYEVSYFNDMDKLNILRPSISCRATGHIPEMLELIEGLIKKGNAYVTPAGNVYFDVRTFPDYGKLSGRSIEEAIDGERIENAKDKKNKEDFALWKKADSNHIMQWESPWGRGYPGWHIECSVMSTKYLGETFDIHGGGLENSFPHHECEIAQSEAYTGKQFVKYFVHHNMLTVNGTKMGKSLGNFIILKDLFEKVEPMVLRFYILQGHYRSPLDFTDEALNASKSGFERMKNSIFSLKKAVAGKNIAISQNFNDVDKLKNDFIEAIDDDFNTPIAISIIYEILKLSNTEMLKQDPDYQKLTYINNIIEDFTEKILGFTFESKDSESKIDDKLIELLIDLRNSYKQEKNYKMSDKIRDDLKSLGITLKDSPNGTGYTK
ncbi:MAG: cysteine--tRNA ligase [Spirochaetes bacterium GWC1_27_15]|nr:MAG: cysteine--tRNA ligase [Spirochaetes bacterium GWB1_27_13]OHD21073.1 MAG: cysteine--tRNA ligase [Spirochaetes bacterium GWC1_27_15]